jgi:hypothetical protein
MSSTGFHSLCVRLSSNFAAKIMAGRMCLCIRTFNTVHEATHVFDHRRKMNFSNIESRARAGMLAPQPLLMTREDNKQHHWVQQELAIAETGEKSMEQWKVNHP